MEARMLINNWDIAILTLYFLGVLCAGIFAMFRSSRNSVNGYFLAGRYMTWIPVGASLFASNIGSEHFIGLAGAGAARGISVGAFEFNAAILLQLLGWVFLPVYLSSGAITLPEYMKRRFGGNRIQLYLTVLSLLLYIFTKISVNLYSGALFVNEALGWNIWYAIMFLLAMTAVITLTGGLTAVLYTDLVQCVVMLSGAIVLSSLGFYKIGGLQGLLKAYGEAIDPLNVTSQTDQEVLLSLASSVQISINTTGLVPSVNELTVSPNVDSLFHCRMPSSKAFVMLRGVEDPEMPWLAFLFGQTPASIWYWCADQMMVQRVLASKSISHAQGATLMAGVIKLFPIFIMIMPGMISRVLYPETVGCGTPDECEAVCRNRYGCSDWAYPKLVMGIMPQGLRGLMLAVMLAALMSDLTSIFNSSSTLFTVDIYTRIRKNANNRELMVVGRLFVLVMVGLSILWVPVIQNMQSGQLFIYIQSVSAYLSPPIASVYLMAILWKRNNEVGAFTGLMYGFILGVIRMILSFIYTDPICGAVDPRPWIVAKVHYMYFAMFSFFSTILVMCITSLLTKPPQEEQIRGVTYWTRKEMAVDVLARHDQEIAVEGDEFWDSSVSQMGKSEANFFPADTVNTTCETGHGDAHLQDTGEREPPESDVLILPSRARICRHICSWVCGMSDRPCPDGMELNACCRFCLRESYDERNEEQNKARRAGGGDNDDEVSENPQTISSGKVLNVQKKQKGFPLTPVDSYRYIKQTRTEKIVLGACLCLLTLITVFCYLFFTFYFGDIKLGPVPVDGNSTSIDPSLHYALSLLLNNSIIVPFVAPTAGIT